MATFQTHNFDDVFKGDNIPATEFIINVNAVAKDLTATTITCKFRRERKSGVEQASLTEGGGITVTDAEAGTFEIDTLSTIGWEVGTYFYDIQFDDAGVIRTYIDGKVKIKQDVA